MSRPPALNPRKQAVQARATRTIEIILEAAARILEARGLEGYTTNAIAERAGVSIGSLYQYFPNKDSITIALIARESAQLLADFSAAAELPDWRFALVKMVTAAVMHQMQRPQLARLLDIEEARLPSQAREANVADVIHPALVALLNRSQKKLANENNVLAFDMMAITRGITDMAGARGETDAEALLHRVLRAVFRYLGEDAPI